MTTDLTGITFIMTLLHSIFGPKHGIRLRAKIYLGVSSGGNLQHLQLQHLLSHSRGENGWKILRKLLHVPSRRSNKTVTFKAELGDVCCGTARTT